MLLAKKIIVLAKYLNFASILLEKLINVFSKQTKVNKQAIKFEKGKYPSYRLIYSLGPIEFKTPKTYIKTNLANGFIWASKLPVGALILFTCKPDGSLRLCVDYWGLNNFIIKYEYLLHLIGKLLNRLGQAK